MRWGLSISLSGELADPTVVAGLAVLAEEAGWDGVFVWDHLWNHTLEPFADPFVSLAAIATATERIRIGTMVTALPRRRPQLVAQATTSLDHLSNGRMVLGLGLGVDSYGEYTAFDEPDENDRARAETLDSGIDALKQMLAGEAVASAGGRITTVASAQQPRVPIWIAGTGSKVAGPRRVKRKGVEGLALVGEGTWSADNVTAALQRGGLSSGEVDLALVGGDHPEVHSLAEAGATWCIPEIMPGTAASQAKTIASAARH